MKLGTKIPGWRGGTALALLVLLAVLTLISLVQAEEAQKLQDLRRLLTLINTQQLMEQQADRTIAQLKERYPKATAEQWKAVRADLTKGNVVDQLMPIYDKHLTSEEVKAMLAFYDTPAGRSLLTKLPRLQEEAAAATTQMSRQRWDAIRTMLRPTGGTQ